MKFILLFSLLAFVANVIIHYCRLRKIKQLLKEIEFFYGLDSQKGVVVIKKVELEIDYGAKVLSQLAELILIEDNLIILPTSILYARLPGIQVPSSNNRVTLTKVDFTHVADNIRLYYREVDLHSYRSENQRLKYVCFTFRFADAEQMKPLADHLKIYYSEFIS